jgi:hypothetical protein
MLAMRSAQSHIFVSGHWGTQIKILDVHRHEFCTGGRDDAVYQKLDGK